MLDDRCTTDATAVQLGWTEGLEDCNQTQSSYPGLCSSPLNVCLPHRTWKPWTQALCRDEHRGRHNGSCLLLVEQSALASYSVAGVELHGKILVYPRCAMYTSADAAETDRPDSLYTLHHASYDEY